MNSLTTKSTKNQGSGGFSPEAVTKLHAVDAEMESIGTFRLNRTLTATRNGHKIAVHISRDRSQSGYYASAKLFGKQHSAWGKLPSHAFAKIIRQLCWTIDEQIVKTVHSREAISFLPAFGGAR